MSFLGFLHNIAEDADFAEESMRRCMNEIAEYASWSIGHFFMLQENSVREIVSRNHWSNQIDEALLAPFMELTDQMRVVWGGDVPGRVIASGNAEWFSLPEFFPDCPRMAIARTIGMKSAFAFPVLVNGEVFAVFEFYSDTPRELDPELIEISRFVAKQIARMIERDRLAMELVRARQDALDASVAKSNFLAQVSHEIRTPLNAVLGMTHLILSTRLDPEQKDYADSIKTSAHSLLRIVNDILDISRIEAGKFEIQSGDFQVDLLLKDTLAMLAHLAHGKGVEFSNLIDPDLPSTLRGDAGRLRQILLNLVGNAIKFTEHGAVSIRVLCEERPQGPAKGAVKVRFEVEDTGIGIPASLHPKLFDVFTQADNSATRKYGGTGLGLSISKRLVELMGGEIGFHSQEGVGSIFWFTLDLQDAEQSLAAVSDTAQLRVALTDEEHRWALVVEDNEINQRLMTRMLEAVGLRVVAVASGAEAITSVKGQKFDLIFMDCQMPGMDGYEATKEIRRWETEAGKSPVPIIAVTASVIKGDRERCLAVGMNDYLSKPIDPDLLISRINQWLKKSLDLRALERIRQMNVEGEADFLAELVKIFRDTSPSRIDRMRSAIESRDGRALAREAHYLKSSSANLGAMQLSSICQKLDEMGRSDSFDGAAEALGDLADIYPGVCSALQREVHDFQT